MMKKSAITYHQQMKKKIYLQEKKIAKNLLKEVSNK